VESKETGESLPITNKNTKKTSGSALSSDLLFAIHVCDTVSQRPQINPEFITVFLMRTREYSFYLDMH